MSGTKDCSWRALSSEILCPAKEALLLRSVLDRARERGWVLFDLATALMLARLTLALRTAVTKAREESEDIFL
jgi:hypothetical protein